MARKPNPEGGKRDEIIAAATELFFTGGFEGTSVRKILGRVGGEVGMFYHYFASKEELFDVVVDWTIRSALHERTVLSLIPAAEELLKRFGYRGGYPTDIAAAMAVAAFSAAIHSESFQQMEEAEQKQLLLRLIADNIS